MRLSAPPPPAPPCSAFPRCSPCRSRSGLPLAPAYARGAPDSFADLAAKLLPAVVNVSSSQLVTAHNGGPGGPGAGPDMPLFPPGSPFEQFFKDFLNRNHPGRAGRSGRRPAGAGAPDAKPRVPASSSIRPD